jgi:ferredoxin like protein
MAELGSVPQRLGLLAFHLDEECPHIEVDQDAARATGAAALLERVCPAHVYRAEPDGSIGVTYAACLECGTCLAVAPPGVLRWHYPRGGFGVTYREG